MNRPPRGHVRVRPTTTGGYTVTVPAGVGRIVGPDRLFRVELVDEGILLRAVSPGEPVRDTLPRWLMDGKPGKKTEHVNPPV